MNELLTGYNLVLLLALGLPAIYHIAWFCTQNLTDLMIRGIRTLTNRYPESMFKYSKFYKED